MNLGIYQCCRLSGCGFAVVGRKVVSVSEGGCGYRYQRALNAVRQGEYPRAPVGLWHERAFVLEAVTQDGLALQYAGATLHSDRGIAMAAVNRRGLALQYAGATLHSDRGIAHGSS